MAGVNVPLLAAEHFYVVTDASPDIPRNLPVLRVPDECAYVKEEAGKLLIGFFEPKGKPLPDHMIPEDSEFLNLPDDWDHLARELELAVRAPADPEAHRAAHLLQRPGELHARRPLDPRRGARPAQFLRRRRLQLDRHPDRGRRRHGDRRMDGGRRADVRPHELRHPPLPAVPGQRHLPRRPHRRGARPALCRPVPLSQPRRARAACAPRRCTSGWRRAAPASARRPAGSAPPGSCPRPRAPAARRRSTATAGGGRPGSTTPPRSTRRCAPASACSTSRRSARSASRAATPRPCCSASRANDVAVAPGRIVYTQWLNRNGGIEADLTVARLSDDAFLVVTSSATRAARSRLARSATRRTAPIAWRPT